jgi:hypothetical protein
MGLPDPSFFSLKATFIRQAILRVLNRSLVGGNRKVDVPQLLVYDFPTVRRLTAWVESTLSGSTRSEPSPTIEGRIIAIQAMVDKYRLPPSVEPARSVERQSAPKTLLITGTTGALGSHLLSQTAQDPTIQRIYALGRARSLAHLGEKHKMALESRGLSSELLNDPKVVLVVAETLDEVTVETLAEVRSACIRALAVLMGRFADETNSDSHLSQCVPAQFQLEPRSI